MNRFFLLLCLFSAFCFGQYSVGGVDPNDPQYRMEERRNCFREQLKSAQKIADSTKDQEAQMICGFLRDQAVIVAPILSNGAVNFIIGDSAKSDNYIFVIFVFREDLSLSEHFARMMTNIYVGSSFNPDTRILVVKTWLDISETWSSILFLHECWHAYEYVFTPYNWSDKREYCLHERTTHEFENRLLSKIGGSLYDSIMQNEIKRLEFVIDSAGLDWRESFISSVPVPALDQVFGKCKSKQEENLRYTHFWIHKYFILYERRCVNKKDENLTKELFLYANYKNRNILR